MVFKETFIWHVVFVDKQIDGLAESCGNFNVFVMELLQSSTKPSIWSFVKFIGNSTIIWPLFDEMAFYPVYSTVEVIVIYFSESYFLQTETDLNVCPLCC